MLLLEREEDVAGYRFVGHSRAARMYQSGARLLTNHEQTQLATKVTLDSSVRRQ